MITVFESDIQKNKTTRFQKECDLFSKQCAVLLGFVVPISTFATQVALLFLIVSWFLAGNLKEKIQFILRHPVSQASLFLFGAFIVGSLYTQASSSENIWMLEKMGKLLYIPFLLPIMQTEKWRRAALLAFLSAMLLTLCLSMLKTYGGFSIFTTRFTATCVFRDHIFTNLMMAFASFMVGHLLLTQKTLLMRLVLGVFLFALVFYILFMSEGRSGYVVFSVLCLLWGLQRSSAKGLAIGCFALSLLLGLAYSNSHAFQERITSVKQDIKKYKKGDPQTSVGERLEFLNQTWQLSKQRLWFGYGTGSFKAVYQNHATKNRLIPSRNPHNEYLNILFQLGVFGLAIFIGFFVYIFKWSFALPSPEKWFVQGIIVAIMTGFLANSWLMDFTSGYFFVMIVAFCFGALKQKKGLLV